MNKITKAGLVLGGYVAAFAVACVLVYIRELLTSGPAAQAASGMYAGGDLFLFMGAFGVMSLVPTGLGLYFLRPYQGFWTVFGILALLVAVTGPLGACLSALTLDLHVHKSQWGMAGELGFLRSMGAPLMVLVFLTCAAFAPTRRPRWSLLVATAMECAASAYFLIHLWLASRL